MYAAKRKRCPGCGRMHERLPGEVYIVTAGPSCWITRSICVTCSAALKARPWSEARSAVTRRLEEIGKRAGQRKVRA